VAARKSDAPVADPDTELEEEAPPPEDQVDQSDYPRNEFGTLLNPEDGQPVFNTVTGESRAQYLARKFEEDKKALLDELAETIAADQAAEATPTPQEKD
jgi:hypothetical protein